MLHTGSSIRSILLERMVGATNVVAGVIIIIIFFTFNIILACVSITPNRLCYHQTNDVRLVLRIQGKSLQREKERKRKNESKLKKQNIYRKKINE